MITVENHKGAIALSVKGKEIDVACEFAALLSYLDEYPKIKNLAIIAKNAYVCSEDRGSEEEAIKKAEDYAKNGKIPNNKLSHEELEKSIEQATKRLVDSLRKLAKDDEK